MSGLADGLVDRGHDVTIVASGGSRTTAALLSVFDVPPSRLLGSTPHEVLQAVVAYGERNKFDVVHDHSGLFGAAVGALVDGPPVVHTLHGPWTAELGRFYRRIGSQVSLIAISHDQASRAPHDVALHSVVHNGIPAETYPFRPDARGREGFLAYVGRACREKGPEIAVEVARRLGRPLKMAVKVNEAPERAYWEEIVVPALPGADVEVCFNIGNAEKGALMADADALLFTACWAEPFGLVPVEAMACGTPVVAFGSGAVPEVVADRRTGFVVPPGDVEALCDAVDLAPQIDPGECASWVAERFSAGTMARRYEGVYADVSTARENGGTSDEPPLLT